jgi:H+/Cl- antiporter ClcA
MISFPSLKSSLKQYRLTSAQAWSDRLTIWLAAVAAGLSIVGFSYLTELALERFYLLRNFANWAPLIVTPLGGVAVVWLTRRYFPYAAGSGIPQVIVAMDTSVKPTVIHQLVSIPVAFAKCLLGSIALACGFSTGREGPSVQIAAAVFYRMRSGLSHRTILHERDLLLAGGAAGIAAAFNAPLAGIVFAIEELSKRFEQRTSGLIVTGIVLAGLVAVAIQGNFTYFGRLHIDVLSPALLIPGAVCALVSGLLGGFFSRLLIQSTIGTADWASQLRQRRPLFFAAGCGLMIAILGFISDGAAHGSGYQYTKQVLDGGEHMPMFYVGTKLIATWLSYWSGVPGGIFAPSLAIGAGIGNDIAILTQSVSPQAIVAIGMVGFLAAVTQAPITSFIIVMEMIDGHAMVLSLMATALTSATIARLISPSLYHSLALLMRQKLEPVTVNGHTHSL